jgi:hypothetical protein
VIGLIALAAAAAAAPRPGELKTFKDWTVGCDNKRACQAVALMPEGALEQRVTMALRRGPEAHAAPEISFDTDLAVAALAARGRRIEVSIEQKDGYPAVRRNSVAAMLEAIRSGGEIETLDASGKRSGKVSLSGANAALLYMDEQQLRLGTVTALVRKGSRPASAVPAPPPLPVVAEVRPLGSIPAGALPKARLARFKKAANCDPALSAKDHPAEARRFRDGATLILVPCSQGAYNGSSLVLVSRKADRSDLQPAAFDFNASAGKGREPLTPPEGAYWHDETGRLASFFKGRGLGDCGAGQSWAWDGRKFRLIHAEAMGECRGSTDYITTWRARVR